VRGLADPDASTAEKNAWETKGLKAVFEPARERPLVPGDAGPSLQSGGPAGLAQASQSPASIWLTDDTASRVISDESIEI
jgi:hypothetical protein